MKKESKALRAKRVGIAAVLVFMMLISTVCVISPTNVIAQDIGGEFGGDFRIGLKESPNTFNPLDGTANDAALQIIDLVYDSLGRVKADSLMLEPWIAKSWTVDANNEKNVTVTLREDVVWHDMTPLTAVDVNYTFGANGYNIPYIASTTIVDDHTIIFHLDAPTALFFSEMMEMKIVPNGYTTASEINGCGPFSYAGASTQVFWDKGSRTRNIWTIEAFDDYFNGRPYLDSIVYIYYIEGFYYWDSSTMVGSKTGAGYDMLNGTIDLIGWDLTTNETASTIIEIGRTWGMNTTLANPDEKNTTIHSETGLEYRYLGMNTNRTHILNDLNVRMAIAHVIDKNILAAFDISGGLVVSDSIISPQVTPWFNTNLASFENDIDLANSYLNHAGYFDADNDGYRQMPGTPAGSSTGLIELELLIPTQDEDISAPSMGDVLWKAIDQGLGLKTTINGTLDEDARLQRVLDDNFDFFLSTEKRAALDPGFMYDLFHSEKVSQTDENHNMFNFEGRAREYYGIVSVNNTTMVGQMNHTNVFDDGTANITAYRNGEVWGVAEGQEAWVADTSIVSGNVNVDLLNKSIDDGYKIYRNRSLSKNRVWNATLNDVINETVHNVPVTAVNGETLISVNTSAQAGVAVASTPRTNVFEEVLTGGPPPDTLVHSPVETGTLELWKESDIQETVPFSSLGVQNVLIVNADPNYGYYQYYEWSALNHSATVTVWDVGGSGKPTSGDMAPYNIVIWVAEPDMNFDGSAFNPTDEGEVGTYLDGGGNFFFSSISWSDYTDGMSYNYDAGDFAYDYLALDAITDPYSADETSINDTGIAPFAGVGTYVLDWSRWVPGGGFPTTSSDELLPTAFGDVGFFNDGLGAPPAGPTHVQYDSGVFKTMFLGVPFEVLSPADADQFMGLMIDWFVPPSGGSVGQLSNGGQANETIINWHVWDDTSSVYLQNTTDYTLDPGTGQINTVADLSGNTIIVFYNYTTTMVEGTDYNTLTTYNYMNGIVNVTISYNGAEDQIKANYTWYPYVAGGNLPLAVDGDGVTMEIRNDNYVIWWDNGGAPINWAGNFVLDNATGAITFNNPLGPGENVEADYTLFNPTYYGVPFTWQLAHGAGANEDIATADFHLMKNGVDMTGTQYTLNPTPGTVDILAPGVLTYNDALTADYWYYDPATWPSSMTFQLAHGAPANEAVTDITTGTYAGWPYVRVINAINGVITDYTTGTCSANLNDGTFTLPGYAPGDLVLGSYAYYDPATIVYAYDLAPEPLWGNNANDCISEGTFVFYLNDAVISPANYVINYATGHIDLNAANVPLGPHDRLDADYYYLRYYPGSDYSLDQTNGILTVYSNADQFNHTQPGDVILADYTYETYTMRDHELGQITILNNLDPVNDTLTMSFDFRKFDELIEKSNEQMTYEMRAEYIKDAQGFIAEQLPCIPLFSSKVASAFNNTRYEGWDSGSMPGGILNFWTFTNVRNKILGEMQVSISAFPGFVTEGDDIDLEVRVEDLDGNSIPDVNIEFEGSGTFGAVEAQWQDDNGNGVWDAEETGFYVSTLTAPATSISRTIIITATATRPSYVMGVGQVQLTVHPIISQFDIEITRGATSIGSGNQTDITVTVRDSDTQEPVTGVQLALAVSPLGLGGSLQDTTGTTDGAGEFATVFMTANVTVDTTFTISVTASMDGYVDETQTSSVSVSRDPNIEFASDKGFLGLPAPPFLVILVLLGGLSITYAGYRRKKR